MDPRISWIQPEQLGPSTDLWMTFWKTLQGLKCISVDPSNSTFCGSNFNSLSMRSRQPDFIPFTEDERRSDFRDARSKGRNSSVTHGGKKRRENPASTYDINYSRDIICLGGMPWKMSNYPSDVVGLHMEIEEFYNYMRPTDAEQRMREHVIREVEEVIRGLWEHARVDVFGSFKTELYLPTSDIDLVVFGEWTELPLWTLHRRLILKGIAEESSIKVLDRAAVPIVKLTHAATDVKVDISFNMEAGVRSVSLIKKFISDFPALPKLVFVLKQFLLQRDLNEVWTGGISSYSLILLCVSFFQMHARDDGRNANANLGVLLIEFFELYGRNFNFMNTGIRVKDGGGYIRKEELMRQMENGSTPPILSIEDPLTPGNDLGKGSYGVMQVKQAFEYAYKVLSNAMISKNYPKNCLHSTLSRILKVTDEVIEYRQEIRNNWSLATRMEAPHVQNASQHIPSPSSISSGRSSDMDELLASAEVSNESSPIVSSTDSEADLRRQLPKKKDIVITEKPSPVPSRKEKPPNLSHTPASKRKEGPKSKINEASSSSQSEQEKRREYRNTTKRKQSKRDFESSKNSNKKSGKVSGNSTKGPS